MSGWQNDAMGCTRCVDIADPDHTAPDIDGDKEEEPDNVNEVPVPSSRFKPEMMILVEVIFLATQPADREEERPDKDVEAMEPCGHIEG